MRQPGEDILLALSLALRRSRKNKAIIHVRTQVTTRTALESSRD